jgi:predicted thioesterase
MDLAEIFQPGMSGEDTFVVEQGHLALHVGSGSAGVLATPWLIAYLERVAHRLLVARLPAGYSSVGVWVDVRHLAPTPLGSQVRARVELVEIEGMRATFTVQAWDETELIGEGKHQRVVIDEARFLRRVAAKGQPPS